MTRRASTSNTHLKQKDDISKTIFSCKSLLTSGLKPDSLLYFLNVAQYLSFSQAAEELGVEVASVSRKIKTLESRIEAKLFERSSKGVNLTSAGQVLLKHCHIYLTKAQQTLLELKSLDRNKTNKIKIAYVSSAILTGNLQCLKIEYSRLNPSIIFEIDEVKMDKISNMVETGLADIGIIRSSSIKWGSLTAISFSEHCFCLAVPDNHPIAIEKTFQMKNLKKENFIVPEQASGTEYVGKIGNFKPKCISRPGSLLAVLAEVSLGSGIAIVPSIVIQSLSVPNVTYIPLNYEYATSELIALCRTKNNSPAVEGVIQFMKARAIKRTILNAKRPEHPLKSA